MTLARAGDASLVIDTATHKDSTRQFGDSVVAANPVASSGSTAAAPPAGLGLPGGTGPAYPPIVPADLDALKREALIVPVAGVAVKDLRDSFDDARGDGTRKHEALDIMAARNTPVLSAVSGVLLKYHNSVAGGLTIYVSDPSNRYVLMYGHLDSYKPGLREGEALKKGDIIGFVGSTGDASPNAPHLHFAIMRNDNVKEWWKGTPLNPFLVYRSK
ncbi:MAG TPA: M23 family metallopeptidase [Gemmatimonadaceae bacterium]|nr:M23 family metallopeptidase [Gemmatimonadaceae bacterium]